MGIRKSATGWKVVARVRVDGKIVARKVTIHGSKEEAKARLESLKAEIRASAAGFCSVKALHELSTFKDVLDFHRIHGEKAPFSEEHLKKIDLVEKEIGDFPLGEFAARFEHYYHLLRTGVSKVTGRPLGPGAVNRRVEIAIAAFETARRLKKIPSSPISSEMFPKLRETPRDVMIDPEKQREVLNKAATNARTAHLVEVLDFLMQVPCRKSEVVRMKIQDIDQINQCVRVYSGTTKNDAGTWKPIPPSLREYFARRVKEAKSIDEPIFGRRVSGSRSDRTGENSRFVPLGDFKRAWDTIRKEAGIGNVRIHDTRHVSATSLIDNGTPEQVVQMIAGWKTDMLKTYYNRSPKRGLSLVRFTNCDPAVNPSEQKRAAEC